MASTFGRALDGALARLLPVDDSLCKPARLGVVMREEFGLGGHRLGKRASNTWAMR